MPEPIRLYVRWVDAIGYRVGRFAMYLIFPMGYPVNWVMEMSQFMLSAYYLLGGAYSLQIDAHVRMDLFYGMMSPRRRAMTDAFTILFVIFYLAVLFRAGMSSTEYAITYGQKNYTAWAPPLWPIKTIMTFGIFLMLLQSISTFFKNVAEARGKPLT
jgi:TRAP-type mannitol/chloroaromatic compound transport system permease small subunit